MSQNNQNGLSKKEDDVTSAGAPENVAAESISKVFNACRVCLNRIRPLVNLFTYRSSGSYAELLTTFANVQVSVNDAYVDKICNQCSNFLEKAVEFKRIAEESDRRIRAKHRQLLKKKPTRKIQFDSIKDIKEETCLNIKNEPNIKVEIEVLGDNLLGTSQNNKDFVIWNTVIKKVDSTHLNQSFSIPDSTPDISWNPVTKTENYESDFDYGGDFANDDDDEDYTPLVSKKQKCKKSKDKIKKGKKVKAKDSTKENKRKKLKIAAAESKVKIEKVQSIVAYDSNNTLIKCYPITKSGKKGEPLVLKRPRDSTILKSNPNYKPRSAYHLKNNTDVLTRVARPAMKPREKLVCPVCGVLTFGLGNHMATHSEKKRYPCTQCNRTFAQRNNMLTHLKTHSGVKDHICEICGAGFYCQKSLLRHNLIHKGDRPYGCSLCSKRFIARCDLTRHLRIHAGYKPYKCTECSMSFNAKHQLQNHERMHTGEKPYSCEVCNVSFSYKVNLNNHVYKVHGINLKFKSIHTITEEILKENTQTNLIAILVDEPRHQPHVHQPIY